MISIIICSRQSDVSDSFRSNIHDTIGSDYELVVVDNHDNHHTIFSAYNDGVSRAKGEILCFMHDDVVMHTMGWGVKVEWYLSDKNTGAIGVAGSHVVPVVGDWRMGYERFDVLNFEQRSYILGRSPYYEIQTIRRGIEGQLTEVATLDGVWFCIRKEIFEKGGIHFDSDTFHAFHLYDVDICLQIQMKGFKLFVCNDIMLEHFSVGNYSTGFSYSLDLLHKKWHDRLPLIRGCDVSIETLCKNGEHSLCMLQSLIERDNNIKDIKAWYNGDSSVHLTSIQRKMIATSGFFFIKKAIKFYPDRKTLNKMMVDYLRDSVMQHKPYLLWKYFVYRILHFPSRECSSISACLLSESFSLFLLVSGGF